MAVMTPQKILDPADQDITKKHLKSYYKTRPITATLEHPLILDIKLLKRLDMTTFTKKGLIALSKFCGISLITKTDTKRKFNKCVKSNLSKKLTGDGSDVGMVKSQVHLSKKDLKGKRKKRKQIIKPVSPIRFKITDENVSVDEDEADVVCKNHNEISITSNRLTKCPADVKARDRKLIINDIINAKIENIIPEPCKTCCRSEHPERFHSHPKTSTKLNLGQKTNDKNSGKVIKCATNSEKDKKKMEKNSCANQKASSQESLSPNEESLGNLDCDTTSSSSNLRVESSASTKNRFQELQMKLQSTTLKNLECDEKIRSGKKDTRRTNAKVGEIKREENQISSDENALKYITGCYLCGKQVSPKLRMKHEESCILEWRTQNSLLSPDKRKPEPKRPDFRFTVAGDLDCEGTFESIWANHKESLVPCKKCGRTFFPDRIEKHENCCNNAPGRWKRACFWASLKGGVPAS